MEYHSALIVSSDMDFSSVVYLSSLGQLPIHNPLHQALQHTAAAVAVLAIEVRLHLFLAITISNVSSSRTASTNLNILPRHIDLDIDFLAGLFRRSHNLPLCIRDQHDREPVLSDRHDRQARAIDRDVPFLNDVCQHCGVGRREAERERVSVGRD